MPCIFYSNFRDPANGISGGLPHRSRRRSSGRARVGEDLFSVPSDPLPEGWVFYAVSIELCAKLTKNDRNEKQNRRKFEFSKNGIAIRSILCYNYKANTIVSAIQYRIYCENSPFPPFGFFFGSCNKNHGFCGSANIDLRG